MQATITETERQLAAMLTENTGRHMLDSGGAYGRNWERNRRLTTEGVPADRLTADGARKRPAPVADAEVFRDRPAATLDKYGCITVDVFHYLAGRLEYMPGETEAFLDWAREDERAGEAWLPLMGEWAELSGIERPDGFNTYNWENHLSQVCQGEAICLPGDDPAFPTGVLLQIHGGCDVRGGYTAPKVFRVQDSGYGSAVADLFAEADYVTIEAGDQYGYFMGPDWDGDNWFDGEEPRFWGDEAMPWDDERGAFIAPNGEPVTIHAWES